MVQLIVGEKGKGKTKYLLDKVNAEVKDAAGNIVYLDKSSKHMHELDNKVRLINVTEYPVTNSDQFLGFVCGICSQDYDLQTMYLDSFLKVASLEEESAELADTLAALENISKQFDVNFVLSISVNKEDLPEAVQDKVIVAC
ncbi:MAG: twitching motility protein PilT [Lachnospiraceae bacterium]